MIRNNELEQYQPVLPRGWHRTNFVFAAEIDSNQRADSLWLLHNPLSEPISQTLQQYPFFDLYNLGILRNPRPDDIRFSYLQVFRLNFDQEGWQWRWRTESRSDGGLGQVFLIFVKNLRPVHYVRLVQNTVTGDFRHATRLLDNRVGRKEGGLPSTMWACEGYPGHRLDGCPALVTPQDGLPENWPSVCPMLRRHEDGRSEVVMEFLQ